MAKKIRKAVTKPDPEAVVQQRQEGKVRRRARRAKGRERRAAFNTLDVLAGVKPKRPLAGPA